MAEATAASPLSDCVVVPAGDDPAARRAARLLHALGARVTGEGTPLPVAAAPGSGARADWAASGAMHLTGRADGPPLLAPGDAATAARAALLALDALAGRASAVPGHLLLGERAALTGLRRRAPWSVGGSCRAVEAADGWVAVSLARPGDADLLPALVEGGADGNPWDVVRDWARPRPAAEVADRAQLLGLVAAVVDEAPEPVWPPWTVTSSGRRRAALAAGPAPRVVDLSALWAGPLCAQLLGAAGAEVVRVEGLGRPDGGRTGSAPFDDLLHAGQPSVALDLDSGTGRDQLRALVSWADVVVTSARPRALRQLGIEPAAHLASRTDGVWVAVTAHPPDVDGFVRAGYGDDAAMSAGLVRWSAGAPVPCSDALADPLTGLHAAVAALACLRAGGRHLVEVALSEVVRSVLPAEPTPLPAARASATGWVVELEDGVEAGVALPSARPGRGRSRALGVDTAAVLAGLS